MTDSSVIDVTDYKGLQSAVEKALSDEQRFVRFEERLNTGVLTLETVKSLHHGEGNMFEIKAPMRKYMHKTVTLVAAYAFSQCEKE